MSDISKITLKGVDYNIKDGQARENILKKINIIDGDISETKINNLDLQEDEFPVPLPGEKVKTFLSKVKKFIEDFNNFRVGIITLGHLVNNGNTSEPGYALDARYGKTLQDQLDQLDSNLSYKPLTTGFDLNNALGKYRTESSSIIGSLINKPDFDFGEITIDWYPADPSNKYGIQILRRSFSGATLQIWRRSCHTGVWCDWIKDVVNDDLGNLIADSPVTTDCNNNFKQRGTTFVRWDKNTLNTPYKVGISPAAEGVLINAGMPSYRTQVSIGYSVETLYLRRYAEGNGWNEWKPVALNDDFLKQRFYGLAGTELVAGWQNASITITIPAGYEIYLTLPGVTTTNIASCSISTSTASTVMVSCYVLNTAYVSNIYVDVVFRRK